MEENVKFPTTRVRINLSQTAKGLGQLDISSEAPTVEEAKILLSTAIDEARAIMAEKGIKEAGRE